MYHTVGQDSSVSITTCYRPYSPGTESVWGRDFPHTSRPALVPTQPLITIGTGSFPGVKQPGRGVDHPPPSSAKVKERVELYLYSPFGPSWPIIGRTLPMYHTTVLMTIFQYCNIMHSSLTYQMYVKFSCNIAHTHHYTTASETS
jgi:hypothetical protein